MYLQASDLRQVMQSLRFALQPAVETISVDWTVPEGVTVDMLSPPINTLFQGQRALIYAQIKGQVKASNRLLQTGTIHLFAYVFQQPNLTFFIF